MGRGYLPEAEITADYKGLMHLLKETHSMFAAGAELRGSKGARAITMAYYPDGKQEMLLKQGGAHLYCDLLHMMSYDQPGAQHSSMEFGKKSVQLGLDHLPPKQLTLGLPFYGRHSATGDWVTYEDIVQQNQLVGKALQKLDSVPVLQKEGAQIGTPSGHSMGFNGFKTIGKKTAHAAKAGVGGVMIWEVGQDCRIHPVTTGGTTHVTTCPDGENSSLLVAIQRAMRKAGVSRARTQGWVAPEGAPDQEGARGEL